MLFQRRGVDIHAAGVLCCVRFECVEGYDAWINGPPLAILADQGPIYRALKPKIPTPT